MICSVGPFKIIVSFFVFKVLSLPPGDATTKFFSFNRLAMAAAADPQERVSPTPFSDVLTDTTFLSLWKTEILASLKSAIDLITLSRLIKSREPGFDLDERIRCLLPISTKPTFFNLNRNKCLSKALGIFNEVAIVDSVATDPIEMEYELEPSMIPMSSDRSWTDHSEEDPNDLSGIGWLNGLGR